MPQPAPRLDDDGLVAEILARVPEAGDERRVRSLLAAWWRYAGVRNAAGAVVDSETFIAERGALGLLELQPTVAARVIELEFALLHDPEAVAETELVEPTEPPAPVASEPPPLRVVTPPVDLSPPVDVAPPAEPAPPVAPLPPPVAYQPPPPVEEPAVEHVVEFEELISVEEPASVEEPVADEPELEEPVAVAPPVEYAAPPVEAPVEHVEEPQPVERVIELDEPDEDEDVDLDAEPDPHAFEDEDEDDDDEAVPISAFEAFQEERYRSREEAQTAVLAGIVVFFSLVVGLALLLGSRVEHLSLPTAADEPLVTGWRAFLAIVTGFGGFAIGLVAAARLGQRRGAAMAPTVGLLGLGVLGLGLLSGSVPLVAVGGVVFALGGIVAILRR